MSFSGKVIVVTGASSGIGAALTKTLIERGAVVVGLARRIDKMEAMLKTVPEDCFYPRYCDMSKERDIVESIAWTVTKFGTVDILVNSAGVCEVVPLVDGPTEKWKKMFDVNVLGLCIATRESLKIMRLNGSGHILNINSLAGHSVPHFEHLPVGIYSATKFAARAITEALKWELRDLGSNIKISSISPGSVYTEMHLKITGEENLIEVPEGLDVPESFLQVKDVVDSIITILNTPPNVQILNLQIQALGQTDV